MTEKSKKPRLSRRKRCLFSLLLLAALIIFTELVSLIGLWAINGNVSFTYLLAQQDKFAEPETLNNAPPEVIHPYLGWVLNPLVHRGFQRGERHIPVNEFGFHGDLEPLQKRSPDRYLIAIFGGSVAQQFADQGTDTLRREIELSPRFRDREIEFIDLALGGYKQPQQLIALTYVLALGGEFDAVVNIDGYNETALHPAENGHQDVFASYPRAWFRRVGDHPDPESTPVQNRLWATKINRQKWSAWFSGLRYRYSPTLNLIWQCRDRVLLDSANRDIAMLMSSRLKDQREYLKSGPLRKYHSDEEMYADLVAFWKRCSLQMNQICRANGIEYYHILQPNQYLEGSKKMGPEERKVAIYEGSEAAVAAARAYPLLIKAGAELKAAGVPFHDFTQLFADVEEPIYIDNCCHYNPTGDELIAQALARIMKDSRQKFTKPE